MYVLVYVCTYTVDMFASVQSNILIAAAIRLGHTSRKKVRAIPIMCTCVYVGVGVRVCVGVCMRVCTCVCVCVCVCMYVCVCN